MQLRATQPTQAVRVRTTRAVLPDVAPRPFEWPARPEWYEQPEQEPYDRLDVSDEQPEQEEVMSGTEG